jgi:REP element-mobilizing transposase RayT
MSPVPLYRAEQQKPAYHLRYAWTAWPSGDRFVGLPGADILSEVAPAWESDGLRVLETAWSEQSIQIAFSAKPGVAPVFLASRAKGRLQHALRAAGCPQDFSRKLAVRSIGDNRSDQVEEYIASQVDREAFADAAFAVKLRQFTVVDKSVDLSLPSESTRGRYWYNLHLVLVIDQRCRITDFEVLGLIRDTSFCVAQKKGYRIAALSLMPDHLHVALRGNIDHSPSEIALAFQNNTAYALGQKPIWAENFYVGTFSEYDMNAIRRCSGRPN